MSRQNKVNPGMYTQRGRLSQDDAARELRKQSVIASPHTWQPVHTQMRQRLAPAGDAARDTETSADSEMTVETSPQVEPRPKSRVPRKMTATKAAKAAAPSKAKAKAAKAKTPRSRKSKSMPAKAKTGKAKTSGNEADDEADAKSRAARNAGGWCSAASDHETPKKLSARRSQEAPTM